MQAPYLLFAVFLLIEPIIFGENSVDDVVIQYNFKRIIAIGSTGHLENKGFVVCHALQLFNGLKDCIKVSLVANACNFDELDVLAICAFKRDDGVIICCEACRIGL